MIGINPQLLTKHLEKYIYDYSKDKTSTHLVPSIFVLLNIEQKLPLCRSYLLINDSLLFPFNWMIGKQAHNNIILHFR